MHLSPAIAGIVRGEDLLYISILKQSRRALGGYPLYDCVSIVRFDFG